MSIDAKTAIPWLLSVATVAAGIWQYADKQGQANKEPLLREQLSLMFEASETVATLATTSDAAAWEKARARFWVLYWGPLGIVEDPIVERCMIRAGRIIPPPSATATPTLPLSELSTASLELSHAARQLILKSWEVNLPPLERMPRPEDLCDP